jgi:EmrB/QacA subfamily drug resistance transporter
MTDRRELTMSADKTTKTRVLLVTVVAAGLVFLDTSVLNIALPAIQRDLGIPTEIQQWVVSGYLLTLSSLLLVGGRICDIYGRRRMFRIGLVSYAALAALAALSPSGGVLVAARALEGVAGAMLVPTTLALINAVFPAEERGKAIGTWAAWSGIATLIGPALGGLIIDHLSWRVALLLSPALAMFAFALSGPVPESRDESADRRLDYLGVALVAGGVGSAVFALVEGPKVGWTSSIVLASAVLGVALLPLFLWWESRAPSPVMPLAMFSSGNVAAANAVTFFVYAGLYGQAFYLPLYIQSSLGYSAAVSGLILVPDTILLFFLSPYAGRLNDRFGPRWLMFFGPLIAAVGTLVEATTGPGQLFTRLLPGIVLFGIGLGFTVTPVTAAAIGSAERRYSGIASGFNNAVSRIAGLFAIALMGTVVIALWHSGLSLAEKTAPASAVAALESVRDKAFVLPKASGMTAAEASDLNARAQQAGGHAFRNGMALAAALIAVGGVVSAIWVRGGGRKEREADEEHRE